MMVERKGLIDLLQTIVKENQLLCATLSAPRTLKEVSKIVIRPLLIKGIPSFQITETRQQQVFHRNCPLQDCLKELEKRLLDFKQMVVCTPQADYQILIGKKENITLLKKPPSRSPKPLVHNREKEYLLPEGKPIPFLVALGVMNREGKVYPSKQDKFRQINRYLEMINDVLIHFDPSQPLSIVDFGCGKAYLTFALYHFLKNSKGYSLKMFGVDLKKEVINDCQQLSNSLKYNENLHFICGDIEQFQPGGEIDLVVSLHACDTATDAALEKAIRWKARVILSVPCCQHELMSQVKQETLRPLLRHGILKERFSALATDAARAQLLEVMGYQTQILEFIDVEHTPKNLLIRAVKRTQTEEQRKNGWESYLKFKQALQIDPSLERRFSRELPPLDPTGN